MKACFKLTLGLVFLFFSVTIFAQSQKPQQINMAIGDTLHVGKCLGKSFEYIDIYTKTRISDTARYNEETGDGFTEYYFGHGDFDGKRMPCEMQRKAVVIASYKRVRNKKTGEEETIIIAWVNRAKMQIAMIQIEKAWESGEIIQ